MQQTEMLDMLRSAVRKFNPTLGSALGAAEVACFSHQSLTNAEVLDVVKTLDPCSDRCRFVYQEVLSYTQQMMANAQQQVDEKMRIRASTLAFMRNLVTYLLPTDVGLQFLETGTEEEMVYNTQLQTGKDILSITGVADQVIAVGSVPVGSVVVNDLSMTCSTPQERGEILAQSKGIAEQHRRCVGVEPRLFPSVLASGKGWVFVDRSYRDGERYFVFPVLETFSVSEDGEQLQCVINEGSVMLVSRMLVRMCDAMTLLHRVVSRKRKQALDLYSAEFDEPDDVPWATNPDLDESGGDAGAGTGTGPSASRPQRVASAPKKRAKGGGGGTGAPSDLTVANLFRHDLNTPWQRGPE